MGNLVFPICTIGVFTGSAVLYGRQSSPSYTYVVNGGNCSIEVSFNSEVDGDVLETFNNTNYQNNLLSDFRCNLDYSGLGVCTTEYEIFNFNPFSFQNISFEQVNLTSLAVAPDFVNFTFWALPPTPSQPTLIQLTNNSNSLQVTASMYSAIYGSNLIGCVASAGQSPYSGGDLPTTLSSNPSNNVLPTISYAWYASAGLTENATSTIYLGDMNVPPNSQMDFYFVCYNGNGKSLPVVNFTQTTSSSLPTPSVSNHANVLHVNMTIMFLLSVLAACLYA